MSLPEQRRVLITGASAGIGRAAAALFVGQGDRVIGVARRADLLASVADELGPRFVPLPADVADPRSMDAMAARVLEELGVPDVVVANAGMGLDALFGETPDAALHALFEVNVFGVYRTVRPFLPAMLARGSGRILLVSSLVGKRGIPHYSGYSASKFALAGMAEALHAELWGTGVSAGVICPSTTDTEFQQHVLRHGPAQRRIRPRHHSAETVARVIVGMAASRRRERVVGFESKLLVTANLLAPRLVDWFLARTLTRRVRPGSDPSDPGSGGS